MKKHLTILAIMLCVAITASAQQTETRHKVKESHSDTAVDKKYANFSFLGDKKVPDATVFLPGPPKETDALYQNDLAMYKWGKEQRGTLRGDTAVWDGRTDMGYMMQRFGWAIHKDITPENCPNLAKLLNGALRDISTGAKNAKKKYARHRPYQVFKEHTPTPKYEREDDYTSYPSGHSVRAWAVALILVAIDPADENAIMKTGYDICESRVILGFHFQSDIEAAKLCASAGFARLVAEPEFLEYLQLARQELQNIK